MTASKKPAPRPENRTEIRRCKDRIARLERELNAWRLSRAKANLEILRLVEFSNQVVGNLSSGLIALDKAGTVSLINQAAAEILGLDIKAAKGRPLGSLLSRRGDGFKTLAAALTGASESLRGEAVLRLPGGMERTVGYSLSAFGVEAGGAREGVILLLADLTRQREQETRLQRQEQLASVGRLSADIAHQVRNPLAGIQSLLQVSLAAEGLPTRLRDNLEMVLGEVRKLDRLVTDTLRFARPAALEAHALSLNEVAVEGLGLAMAGAGEIEGGVRVSRSLHTPSPVVVADRDQLREVVLNLVKNALEAMPKGGRLLLETRLQRGGGKTQALLRIADSGAGIPPKVAAHVFDPFFTTKALGSGLGLPACRRIVDTLGGSIKFDSKPGKGTIFTVTLPAVTR